jgi:hypothetical protein
MDFFYLIQRNPGTGCVRQNRSRQGGQPGLRERGGQAHNCPDFSFSVQLLVRIRRAADAMMTMKKINIATIEAAIAGGSQEPG